MKIIVDTREQTPLFKTNCIIKKLDTADYSFIDDDGVDYSDKFAIEYKSPNDIYGTLGKGHDRFKRELERAKDLEYFAIVISATRNTLNNKSFDGGFYIKKMKGFVLLSILDTIHIKYNIPIFMVNGRTEAKSQIKGLINAYLKNRPKNDKE